MFFSLGSIKTQGQSTSVFNTPMRNDVSGTLSSIGENKKKIIDSINTAVAIKKVEYNIGFLPMDSVVVTSPFGTRIHPITGKRKTHRGVDLRGRAKEIKAVQMGIIIHKGYDPSLGQYLKLKSGSFVFIYGHLKHCYVKQGDVVAANQVIGRTGDTGKVTAEHLHFAIQKDGKYIDPLPILNLLFQQSQL